MSAQHFSIEEPEALTTTPRVARLVLGVCGSTAAFKAAALASKLTAAGVEVRCVLTEAAAQFITPLSLAAVTGRPVENVFWSQQATGEIHVQLARWADQMLVYPASQHTLAKLAGGLCDNLLTGCLSVFDGPRWLAPAMHETMWSQPSTTRNVARLVRDGWRLLGPDHGRLADASEGRGRLVEVHQATELVLHALRSPQRDLAGKHVLVTAGPTVEPIDPVRVLANRSSGRTGYALAAAAWARGARVTLITGPTCLDAPFGVEVQRVDSARAMQGALEGVYPTCDILIMAAAVADFRAKHDASKKLKRNASITLELISNPDLLAGLNADTASVGSKPLRVGFALEDSDLIARAKTKMERKGLDIIVANAPESLEGELTRTHILSADGVSERGPESKVAFAHALLDVVSSRLP